MPGPRSRARSPRPLRCSFTEGGRRCPREGSGEPPLCRTHRIAIAEASRPRSPIEVLAGALDNFLAGKPINVEATVGAAAGLFDRWGIGGGIAAGYHPDVMAGERESSVHSRAARGRPWQPWNGADANPPQVPGPTPEELEGRRIMGFTSREVLTEEGIKDRKRQLAKKLHPDRGGSVERMAQVNHAADVLLASLA